MRLVAEFAPGEDQTGQKRAECHRHAEGRAKHRRADAGDEHGERKRLALAARSHKSKQRRQRESPDRNDHNERKRRAADDGRYGVQLHGSRQNGRCEQQQHDGQILEQEHANGETAGG